jgi:hypothetical protein
VYPSTTSTANAIKSMSPTALRRESSAWRLVSHTGSVATVIGSSSSSNQSHSVAVWPLMPVHD